MLEPSVVILYVEDTILSSAFYQDILGIKPEEDSPTYHSFKLVNGMRIGLKAKHTVEPLPDKNGNGELAFTVDNHHKVDELFAKWQEKEITILMPPTPLVYGYTFLVLDPDGNRLRVVSLGKS